MLIIFLFMNDFKLNTNIYYKTKDNVIEYYFPISEISKIYIPNPFLMKHSYLYRFTILRLNSYLSSNRKTENNSLQEVGRYYLGLIKKICQEKRISLLIAIFPYLKPLDEYNVWQRLQYLNICKVVQGLEIAHINLYNLYDKLLEEDFPIREIKMDDIHPSKEAQKQIADEIFNFMLDKFIK